MIPGGRSPAPSTSTSTGTAESSQDDDGARPVAPLGPQSVVEALRESPAQLGFGFSAGGLLCAALARPCVCGGAEAPVLTLTHFCST